MEALRTGRRLRAFLATAAASALGSDAIAFDFARQDFPSGVAPVYLTAADFDQDEHLDLAVAIFSGTQVALFKGNGQGAFTAAGTAPVGIGPWGMVAADLNGDTRADLAVANVESNDVAILLGNGALGFTPRPLVPVGRYPRAVSAARFDADSDLDLAVSNLTDDTISILLGDGQGHFVPAPLLLGGDGPGESGTADFDRDGHPDLAVGNQNTHDATVWLGNGDGTFAAPRALPAINHPHSALVGDVDGDGLSDVVADNVFASPAAVSVFRGDGKGGFAAAAHYATGDSAPAHLALADFDRDGFPDLVAACRRDLGSVAVLGGDGGGGFLPPERFAVGSRPNAVVAGDFDEDGRPDLATANFFANTCSILLNRTPVTGVSLDPAPDVPALALLKVAPNPFDPDRSAASRFLLELSRPGPIAVRILSASGRLVRTFETWGERGPQACTWDGKDQAGRPVATGVFAIEVRQGREVAAGKVVLLR